MSNDLHEQGYGETRVLWSRIAILGAVLLLTFFLGRWAADDGAAAERALEESKAQVTELQARIDELEAQLDAQAAGGVEGAEAQATPNDPSPEEEAGDDQAAADGQAAAAPPAEEPDGDGNADTGETGGEATATAAGEGTRTYEVQSGDTLISIAEEYYGDASEWRLIAEANNLSSDNVLTVGTVLEIPPAP